MNIKIKQGCEQLQYCSKKYSGLLCELSSDALTEAAATFPQFFTIEKQPSHEPQNNDQDQDEQPDPTADWDGE